jgi:hypothetical protein
LVEFLKALSADFKTNQSEWENWTIDHYLESIAAWIEATNGIVMIERYPTGKINSCWESLAYALYAGKGYE